MDREVLGWKHIEYLDGGWTRTDHIALNIPAPNHTKLVAAESRLQRQAEDLPLLEKELKEYHQIQVDLITERLACIPTNMSDDTGERIITSTNISPSDIMAARANMSNTEEAP